MSNPTFKLTYDDGNTMYSSCNTAATLSQAIKFWLGAVHIIENFENGEEARSKCIKVEQVFPPIPETMVATKLETVLYNLENEQKTLVNN